MQEPGEIQIGFLLDGWLQGVMFNPAKAEGLSFEIKGPNDLVLSVRPMHPDDDAFGDRRGITCKIRGVFSATQDQRDFVAALLQRRFTPYKGMPIKLPYVKHGQEQISADGTMREGFSLPFESYPDGLKILCDEARGLLLSVITRFVKLLIWNLRLEAPPNFIQTHALYWQIEKGTYSGVGLKRQSIEALSPPGITWDENDQEELRLLWDSKADEPLAHELLREARALSDSSPRSALLILATAVEIGVKAYIMLTAPQTVGLVDTMPSPPIYKLFKDYLPSLHDHVGKQVPWWTTLKNLFTSCQKLFDDRNVLTHGRSTSVDSTKLAAYIGTASDLLYILDVLQGHIWARGYVRPETRKKLGWPGPRHPRNRVSMLTHDL